MSVTKNRRGKWFQFLHAGLLGLLTFDPYLASKSIIDDNNTTAVDLNTLNTHLSQLDHLKMEMPISVRDLVRPNFLQLPTLLKEHLLNLIGKHSTPTSRDARK